jgi:nucleotide-binding universal stress UspA family protein
MIALDATPECVEIVRAARSRPWPKGSRFILLHVLDPFPFAKAPISLGHAKQSVQRQLKSAAQILKEAGWETESAVVLGRPRRLIWQEAESWKADLLLVGSKETTAVTRLLLGSTARAVLRHAPCSVEIVRPTSEKDKGKGFRILCPTDGSKYSLAALHSVAHRPWPKDSEVKVISIPEPFMPLGQFPNIEFKEVEESNAAAVEDAKKYAVEAAEILCKAGLKAVVQTPLSRDADVQEIVKIAESWGAQLIVMGSHGRRGFDRMTMGSVSEGVALHAPCSVEVIRAPQALAEKSKERPRKEAKR